ncbi:KxYKxGKxW signal peptide domain-containing protein, partial [Oenococcus oeni]
MLSKESKSHFKLYKSGKRWLVVGITTMAFAIAGFSSPVNVDAEETTTASSATSSSSTAS